MMDPTADFFAKTINPVFVAGLIAAPFLKRRPDDPPLWFWGRSTLAILVAVGLARWGKAAEVWPGHPTFPSGHESFALACTVSLALRDARWLLPAIPLCVLIGWGLAVAHYHYPVDVWGALLTGPGPAWLTHQGFNALRHRISGKR